MRFGFAPIRGSNPRASAILSRNFSGPVSPRGPWRGPGPSGSACRPSWPRSTRDMCCSSQMQPRRGGERRTGRPQSSARCSSSTIGSAGTPTWRNARPGRTTGPKAGSHAPWAHLPHHAETGLGNYRSSRTPSAATRGSGADSGRRTLRTHVAALALVGVVVSIFSEALLLIGDGEVVVVVRGLGRPGDDVTVGVDQVVAD
jgi:hypothetical protein